MRGLSSRLAASALALALGVAGAHSLGAPSPAGASCSDALATTGHVAEWPHLSAPSFTQRPAGGGGWKRAESDRSGSGSDSHPRPCRARAQPASHHPPPPTLRPVPLRLPAGGTVGLLGLGTSPANAPPGS